MLGEKLGPQSHHLKALNHHRWGGVVTAGPLVFAGLGPRDREAREWNWRECPRI